MLPRRLLLALLLACGVPLVAAGCQSCRNQTKVGEDAAPPPPPPQPDVIDLAPEDAGVDAPDANEAGKRAGPPVNPNQRRLEQCCAAIAAQAKQLGSSPEAFQLSAIAGQCYAIAKQVGPQGNAPEFAQVRQLLAGKTLPGGCAGL